MIIEIKKLTSELLNDFLHFFETDAHADNPNEDRCYCVCWCSVDHRIGTDFSSPEKRRELAVQYINNGTLQGFLAYLDNKVVGWCNANTKSDCLNCTSWLRFMSSANTAETDINPKIKSIFCFAIAPAMRRKGIATQLLECVCKDAVTDGYEYVEAYPKKQFKSVFFDNMGPLELYKKHGFTIHKEVNYKYKDKYDISYYIVRKSLK